MPISTSTRRFVSHAALLSCCVGLGISANACGSNATAPSPSNSGGAPGGSGAASSGGAGGSAQGGGTANSSGGQSGTTALSGGAGGTTGGSAQGGDAQGGDAGAGSNMRGYYSTNPAEFLGAPRCAGLDVQICEDFESGTFDPATWELHHSMAGDTPTIDGMHVARGAKAAHFHAANNDFSYILETKTFPEANNTFWGRMFFYIDALPVTPDGAHFTLVEGAGTGDTSKVREGGQFRKFGVGTDGGPTGDWTNIDQDPTKDTAQQIPEQQWVCIEWEYKGDTDETHFYWDGVEHPSLATFPAVVHGANSTVAYHLPEFSSLWIGWWMYQTPSTPDHFDVWIDEIAIDKARIGCSL